MHDLLRRIVGIHDVGPRDVSKVFATLHLLDGFAKLFRNKKSGFKKICMRLHFPEVLKKISNEFYTLYCLVLS